MRNRIIKIFFSLFIVFCFFNTARAATLNVETTVDVPANCTVTDTDGVTHSYGSANSYLALCALNAAISNGTISSVQLSNQYPSFGLFITAINDVVADPNSQYWAIYQNGTSPSNLANLGITSLPIVAGDTIILQLDDFSGNNLGDEVILHITTSIPSGGGPLITNYLPPSPAAVPIPASLSPVKPIFDLKKAYNFLAAQQKSDGSFGANLYTDWTAFALATSRLNLDEKYFSENKLSGNFLTDYERHAMALMALGLNPYNTDGENYIGKITDAFDGKQFGDPNEDNDDIFALIVLQNAGYAENDQIISSDLGFVLSKQNTDGSWDNSVDLTGAGIEALANFDQNINVKNALTKAEQYLKQNQKDDGSWNDNASSTAWALEGILALNEKPEDWKIFTDGEKDGVTPLDYLATIQDADGGVKDSDLNTKIWETAYVASALSGQSWNQIMQKSEKPETPLLAKIPKNAGKNAKVNIKKEASQITATAINAITNSPNTPNPNTIPNQNPQLQKSWFRKLLENIFGI